MIHDVARSCRGSVKTLRVVDGRLNGNEGANVESVIAVGESLSLLSRHYKAPFHTDCNVK